MIYENLCVLSKNFLLSFTFWCEICFRKPCWNWCSPLFRFFLYLFVYTLVSHNTFRLLSCCLWTFLAIFKLQSFIGRDVSHWHLKSNRIVSINHTSAVKTLALPPFIESKRSFRAFQPAQLFSNFTLDLWVNWTRGVNSTLNIVSLIIFCLLSNRTRN